MSEQDPISAGAASNVVGPQAEASPEGDAALQDLAQRRRYRPDTVIGTRNFGFSNALDFMKRGFRVQRAGWNGKGMWICRGTGQMVLLPEKFWNEHTRKFAEERAEQGLPTEVLPYIIMKTADDKILMGWLASQTDLLADDWQLVLG